MAIINNVAYSWSMIQLQSYDLPGESESSPIFVDATAIKWNTERKVESIYGLGGQPRKRGFGNVTYEASITLPYGTQMYLRSQSDSYTLLGLGEFNLVITWVNDMMQDKSSESVTLKGCFFSEGGFDASQDDTSLTKEFNLHPHRIYATSPEATGVNSWVHELYGGN